MKISSLFSFCHNKNSSFSPNRGFPTQPESLQWARQQVLAVLRKLYLPAQLFLTNIHIASAADIFVSWLFIKQSVKGRIQASLLGVSKVNSQILWKNMPCGRQNITFWHFSLLERSKLYLCLFPSSNQHC